MLRNSEFNPHFHKESIKNSKYTYIGEHKGESCDTSATNQSADNLINSWEISACFGQAYLSKTNKLPGILTSH